QKPGGIISANIQANTNLRIALRVTDAGESSDIIGRPDAAKLSRHLPGRAYVRTGSSEVATVQVAYVGGSGTAEVVQAPARTFRITPAAAAKARTVGADGPSHLSGMVAAAADAARQLGVGEQKRPWLPELGELVPIEAIGATVPGLVAPSCSIGLLDDAANQAQDPYVLDLESAGSAAVFGVSGSGKTTALRTIAASVANTYSTREAQIYGLDFAGRGLGGINVLPHVGDVVFGDDLERVRRLIVVLAERSSQRRKKFGDVGASSAAEYRRITSDLMPAIVVLIDGFAQLWSTLEPIDRGVHAETLARVISDGRGAGMHFVITADRRAALPPILSSTIPTRLLLKLANADEYSSLGMRAPEGFEKVPAGRCWAPGGEVQLAALSLGEETDGSAQTRALAEVASSLPAPDPGTAPDPIQLLPELVALEDLPPPAAGSMSLPIGIDEVTLDPVVIDCAAKPLFLAVGPSGSGRTTVLRTLTRSHHHAVPSGEAYLLGGRRSALFDDPWWQETARGADEAEQLTRRLCSLIAEREADPTAPPMLVVIDDADDFADGLVATAIEELLSRSRDGRVTVLAAMTTFKAERSYTNWVQMIRGERHGIILQPDEETSGDVLSSRLPRRAGLVTMPGRGYLVIGGSVGLIQVAS
ncbi:MAG: hypothetical protein GY723_00755, partial [bacterium]|nr:hypothetical protein [bacterium]